MDMDTERMRGPGSVEPGRQPIAYTERTAKNQFSQATSTLPGTQKI